MTKIIGLTGGIGSGKTTVISMFADLGVPVYIADIAAKELMQSSPSIRKKLIELLGVETYMGEQLQTNYLRSKIFKNRNLLQKVNDIVHPEVAIHFRHWISQQNAPYVVKEVAILFESGQQASFDYIITVISDTKLRMQRVIKRDQTTASKIKDIMCHQLDDTYKIQHSHFIIKNDTLDNCRVQVNDIHHKLTNIS